MINNMINNLSNKIFLTRKERKRRSDEFWENFKREMGDLSNITLGKIDASMMTVGKVEHTPEVMEHLRKAMEPSMRELRASEEFDKAFDKAHPILKKMKRWPIVRRWYYNRRREYASIRIL